MINCGKNEGKEKQWKADAAGLDNDEMTMMMMVVVG